MSRASNYYSVGSFIVILFPNKEHHVLIRTSVAHAHAHCPSPLRYKSYPCSIARTSCIINASVIIVALSLSYFETEMTSTFIKSVVRVIILFYLAGFTTPAPIAKNVPHEFEEPDSAESTSQSECEPFASQDVDERNRNTNEEFLLQQKLLSGFRQNDVNRYNISQGGFTSDSDNVPPSCIPVQYYIDECPNDTYIFIWTVFNAKSQTGTILLKLTVFDLRVFAFELCDAYKDPVEISISLAGADSSKDCQNMKRALTDFTTLVSLSLTLLLPLTNRLEVSKEINKFAYYTQLPLNHMHVENYSCSYPQKFFPKVNYNIASKQKLR